MMISISGKKGSGKDTVARIIQLLSLKHDALDVPGTIKKEAFNNLDQDSGLEIKRFADKLKDTVCLWLGCTREQLEDPEFKKIPIGKEWNRWEVEWYRSDTGESGTKLCSSEEEADKFINKHSVYTTVKSWVEMTPRKLMQLLGTDCGREIIHPNIWVNSLFAEYYPANRVFRTGNYAGRCSDCNKEMRHVAKLQPWCKECSEKEIYPNWIIPDTRFPNELAAVEKRGGLKIRVSRRFKYTYPDKWNEYHENANKETTTFYDYLMKTDRDFYESLVHPSEVSLDHHSDWDYVIDNNGSIEELVRKVKHILEQENLL